MYILTQKTIDITFQKTLSRIAREYVQKKLIFSLK